MRLDVDGRRRERELPGRLGRVLLAYLALNHHRAVTRDELIDALWPGGAPGRPGGHAQHAALRRPPLRRTRPRCAAGASCGSTLPADAQLDVETAAARVERSRAALGAGDAGAAAAEAEAALDVLERGLLRGFDAPWLGCLPARARGRAPRRARAAGESRARRGGGGHAPRSHWASRQIVALAPFRESGYALLMEAQAAQGNPAEALETYERLRRLMRDELGATPSPELRAAHQRLLERTVDAPAGERAAGARRCPRRWRAPRAGRSSAGPRR